MNHMTKRRGEAGPWLLIGGLILGAGLLVFMTWDGVKHSGNESRGGADVIDITEANWEKEVLDSDIPVVVDFSASWCGPCHAFAPTLDKIAERYKGKVKVGKVDVDKAQNLAAQYKVSGIPNIMIFKGGKMRKQFQGGPEEAVLARAIDNVLN